MSFVNPVDVLNPNAEPLTDTQTKIMLEDSFRPQYVFIKDHMDPNVKRNTEGAIFEDKDGERGWGVVTFHILKTPILRDNSKIIGYYKLRGPPSFANEGDAHEYGTQIIKSHDSYSRMNATPFGVMQPIVVGELTTEEQELLDAAYKEEIESKKSQEEEFVRQQRLAERQARQINNSEEEIVNYVRQQLRWHAATYRIQKTTEIIVQANKVLEASRKEIDSMLMKNPQWEKEGFEYFKTTMMQMGEKEPTSYFDQNVPEKEIKDLPGFFL